MNLAEQLLAERMWLRWRAALGGRATRGVRTERRTESARENLERARAVLAIKRRRAKER